jgi:pimeloyl-ACP methyl ester carboxylesterase
MKFRIAIALAGPTLLHAQDPERASFYLVAGRDTVVAERSARTASQLQGEFASRTSGTRVTYVASLNADATISTLALHSFRNASDTTGEIVTLSVIGDTLVAENANGTRQRIPSLAGAIPIVNPATAFIEQVMMRARKMAEGGKASVPVFLLGMPNASRASVEFHGDSAVLNYANVTMRLAVTADGHVLGGAVPAQNVRILRGPAGPPLVLERRDYSAPTDAPYSAEDVLVTTPAGLRLRGTLTLPRRVSGPVPAIVTITGSGPEDRDEQSSAIPGYRPFRQIADTLGRRGIAVLRLDDRGVGGSDRGPATVTSADFADDIRAAVAYLRTRPEIDGARIGLVGHSEGGVIAPMVAESDPKIRAIVLMAGSASTGDVILSSQQHFAVDTVAHLTGPVRDSALATYRRNTDSVVKTTPWLKWFVEYDPSATARRVKTPVLILQGENDHQVPLPEASKLAAAFRSGGNRDVTVRTFPNTSHFFVTDSGPGFPYEKMPSLSVRPDVLGAIADWLVKKLVP